MQSYLKIRLSIVLGLIIVITICHYSTDVSVHNMHHIYRRLYYIPIILASFWFGFKWGICCSIFISVVYIPHLLFQHRAAFFEQLNIYLEVVLYNIIGLITGLLSSAQMKEKTKYQQIAIRLEKNLKEIKNLQIFNENILNSIQSGVLTVDIDGRITLINPAAKQILGDSLRIGGIINEFGINISDYFNKDGESRNELKKNIKEINITLDNETKLVLEAGISALINHKGVVTGHVIVFTDHTEKIELERHLARAARLSELGEMAAGIAHEVRNPLHSIKGAAEVISDSLSPNDKKYDMARIMINEIDRLNDLVSNFLLFAKPKEPTFIEADLNDLIRKTLEIVKFKFGDLSNKIELVANGKLPLCNIDPEQIKQVLINIIFNAIEEVDPVNGKVTIRVRDCKNDLIVDVIDNGSGISSNNIEKIFSPFFSTKDNGTGLGLSISQKLAEANLGKISVSNNKDQGTQFSIHLPKVKTV